MKMILVGPNAGKTIKLSGFVFRDGVCELQPPADGAVRLLGGYYSAYPEGSKELEAAQAAWEKNPASKPASAPPVGATEANPNPPSQTGPGVSGEVSGESSKGKKK